MYKISMRRKHNKQNGAEANISLVKRTQSQPHFTLTQNKTLAELNHPSTRHPQPIYHPLRPLRVILPEYFNVPRFVDRSLFSPVVQGEAELLIRMRGEAELRRKLKDLGVLAEGMRRAKNIKEESRYYFTQSVLQHNCSAFRSSIASLQKFLKIVLFIRDEKSVELALNSIGAEYMALGDYQTALEYHRKQGIINDRADLFLSHTNCGLCYQMAGDYDSALSQYEEATRAAMADPTGTRQAFIEKIIARIISKKDEVFLTTHQNQKVPIPELIRNNSSPMSRTKKFQIVQAIRSAEQHLDKFLSGLKDSFVAEDD